MFNQVNDLKSLRMEIALALQHKAKTEDIYEILDAGLKRARNIGWVEHCTNVCKLILPTMGNHEPRNDEANSSP